MDNLFPLSIIADDLTGALDGAVAFCSEGVEVVVAVTLDAYEEAIKTGADVVAVSTGSRDSTPEIAKSLVSRALDLSGRRNIFKKIDSRLKGNLQAELSPFLGKKLFVSPALPSFGRYVEAGYVKGFGVKEPIDIKKKLGLLAVNSFIPDCRSDEDFDTALDLFLQTNSEDVIFIGARGLTFSIARREGLLPKRPPALSGNVGMVIGSRDPITVKQLDNISNENVAIISAPSGIFEGDMPKDNCIVLQASQGAITEPNIVGKQLAKSFRPIAHNCSTLLLSGGATAEAVLADLDINMLYIEGEILPGLPVSSAKKWRIVTKSGGFGDVNTLSRLLESALGKH
ncbi:MAG: four-carbon acid sugar kinase family protein [Alphaproteobacteria bacterium]|nr:four-carbon acid sugar kinase family protein [Alphaproteobacteria bacterium]